MPELDYPGAETAGSLEAAFTIAGRENTNEIHIGGGAALYTAALPYVDRLHLTFVDDKALGDTFFPEFTEDFEIFKEHEPRNHKGLSYQWIDYQRKNAQESTT